MSRFLLACWLLVLMNASLNAQDASSADVAQRVAQYATVRLTTDLEQLSAKEKQMLPLLIDAAKAMDQIFWLESSGPREQQLKASSDAATRRFIDINYGPWDRLNGNEPFVPRIAAKPLGANFYPADLTQEAFESYLAQHPQHSESLRSLYTVVRREDDATLKAIPYHRYFADPTNRAAKQLRAAAQLAEDAGLRKYLLARADALLCDDYFDSDVAWMEMKSNTIDIVIGPIETYEDQLFGFKAAHEAYVLVKDREWSGRLERYAALLPDLQRNLPVPEEYKRENPGSDSDLNAYDVIYYAGDCNAGSKTIAINLPNDERVQLQKGTRRLQLKNAMRAKFDRILLPIAETLIDPDQREHISFDAFFSNTMLHEVAHGLGIKNKVDGQGTVREALREVYPPLEECKADILGLHLASELHSMGVLTDTKLMDHYVTFMAGIVRSVRFGAASAHGRANMISFNYFAEQGAFVRSDDGLYKIDEQNMQRAVKELAAKILITQGDGDYQVAKKLLDEMGRPGPTLQADLERIQQLGIPVDVVFEQGVQILGL